MKRTFTVWLFLCLALLLQAQDTYTIIVSCDGFRWDFPYVYDTPNVDQIAREGVKSDMRPSYPASTFPNHYAMATGLYPDHHGIVNNSFWSPELELTYAVGDPVTGKDPRFFLGEPIWLTAQRQGVISATIYWVGSDVNIQGQHPRYWFDYGSNLISYEDRVKTALEYLQLPEAERPHFIMLYFDEPDHTEHTYGPFSEETREAIKRADDAIGLLRKGLAQLPMADKINLIVVADHGMAEIHPIKNQKPSDYLKPEWVERMVQGIPTSIFTKPEYRDSVYNTLKQLPHLTVWKKEEVPAELHYNTSSRIGDIIAAPDLGWQFQDVPRTGHGAHGYDPAEPDMHALFRAVGPAFKTGGFVATEFHNVDIYPLLCHLLGIDPAPCDGDFERIKQVLK